MVALAKPASPGAQIRAVVVDDSAVIRGLVSRWLAAHSIAVVGSYRTGKDAVDNIAGARAQVAILDIEMPEMDGLTALPLLLQRSPGLKVIVASTLTSRGAESTLRALSLGASDYLPKPGLAEGGSSSDAFQRELVAKVLSLGGAATASATPSTPKVAAAGSAKAAPPMAGGTLRTRPMPTTAPTLLAIGSSTGGPQALMTLLGALGSKLARVPVLITQHMPALFTPVLAQHLGRSSGLASGEGQEGELVKPGRIYVAPGGRHMSVVRAGSDLKIAIDDRPAINFCRPSVEPLFMSVAEACGNRALALMLTGMGADGLDGSRRLVDAGAALIAQDEASSVVWGMPGAVARAGLCSAIVPLDRMAELVGNLVSGKMR